jgi:hypothetical protein
LGDLCGAGRERIEGRTSFCEQKEAKKLFDLGQSLGHRQRHAQTPEEQKFFGSFFQKRTASLSKSRYVET